MGRIAADEANVGLGRGKCAFRRAADQNGKGKRR
jgi:hypothetical protein